jgi:hypothetical protein
MKYDGYENWATMECRCRFCAAPNDYKVEAANKYKQEEINEVRMPWVYGRKEVEDDVGKRA